MSAYELLYAMRTSAERSIVECDRALAARPADRSLIAMRQHYARMAVRYHARIERLERMYEC